MDNCIDRQTEHQELFCTEVCLRVVLLTPAVSRRYASFFYASGLLRHILSGNRASDRHGQTD